SDPKNAAEARGYFEKAGVAGRIDVRIGDALAALAKEKPESFDIIFNDVDKTFYPRVFPLAAARVRRHGLFVTDNVLWSGRVAQKNPKDAETKAIVEFNRLLYSSPAFFTTIISFRCSVSVALR